jgi:tetratricopeptide (TPR) repeat protein
VIACAIALGSAGLTVALDHPPGSTARPELTWAGDAAVRPDLDTATRDMAAISGLVDQLGLQGRGALAALAARDFDLLDRTTNDGRGLVREIRESSAALRSRLTAMPLFGQGADFVFSAGTQARHAELLDALESTDLLSVSWARLTAGTGAAARLSSLLAAHDERITAAIDVGRKGQFKTALARIAQASATLDDAKRLRDQLRNTVDVTTLNEWLRRNGDYDTALRTLYQATAASPNRVTPAIRAALAGEQKARAALPRTTSGLTIVMTDIAQGGLNQAVIAIEQARGRLAAALAELSTPADEPSPSPDEEASSSPDDTAPDGPTPGPSG